MPMESIALTRNEVHLVAKAETHNHPTAISVTAYFGADVNSR